MDQIGRTSETKVRLNEDQIRRTSVTPELRPHYEDQIGRSSETPKVLPYQDQLVSLNMKDFRVKCISRPPWWAGPY